jgi:hypothetical protein
MEKASVGTKFMSSLRCSQIYVVYENITIFIDRNKWHTSYISLKVTSKWRNTLRNIYIYKVIFLCEILTYKNYLNFKTFWGNLIHMCVCVCVCVCARVRACVRVSLNRWIKWKISEAYYLIICAIKWAYHKFHKTLRTDCKHTEVGLLKRTWDRVALSPQQVS